MVRRQRNSRLAKTNRRFHKRECVTLKSLYLIPALHGGGGTSASFAWIAAWVVAQAWRSPSGLSVHRSGRRRPSSDVTMRDIGFCELLRRGEISRLPRLFAIHPENCAPLHATFLTGGDELVVIEDRPTIAEGASIAKPARTREVLAAVRRSGGRRSAMSESQVEAAHGELMGIRLKLGLGPSDLAERDRLRLTQPFLTGTEQECWRGIDVTRSQSRRRTRVISSLPPSIVLARSASLG